MTELDLGLKIGVRKLMWSMGYATRLDVQLRGDRPLKLSNSRQGKTNGQETYTDLDVLGVRVTADSHVSMVIADCKSGRNDKPTSRMFWARGVSDLFGADQIMLVREHEVNDATRQLSARLGITVLPSPDLLTMQNMYEPLAVSSVLQSVLFRRDMVAENLRAFVGLNRKLSPLLEYRDFDYWVYEQHRNPIQLVAHLSDAATLLDSRNPVHLALFLDLAWLYTLAMLRVISHIRGAFLRDPDRGLQEYLFGGATNLREKKDTAGLLESVAPEGAASLSYLPSYYTNLRELVMRLQRRPGQMQTILRYAEAASALMAARKRVTLREAFGESYDPYAAKLLADVCGFLVAATGLPTEFRTQARAWLLSEGVDSVNNESKGTHGSSFNATAQVAQVHLPGTEHLSSETN